MWEKIVLNLLSNAFKFTFEGQITVELRPVGDRVQLRVSDTGVGIPAEDLPRMFERFHRVKHASRPYARRHRHRSGPGAGTRAVSWRRCRGHQSGGARNDLHGDDSHGDRTPSTGAGGRHAASAFDERWRSFLRRRGASLAARGLPGLPATDGSMASAGAVMSEVAGTSTSAPATAASLLIADDNADMRDYLARILSPYYRLDIVGDGRAAIDRIRAHVPELVLADVMMPSLDGFGLLREIRNDDQIRSLPVILLSARAGEEARIEGLEAGADEYLVKPFSARELRASIASLLRLSRERRETERALRYRSEQYRTLLNQAPLGVYVVDGDFRIRDVNPVALPVFGDIPGGIVGRDFDEITRTMWGPDYADEIVRVFRHTLDTGESYFTPERAELRIDRGVKEFYEWRLDRITLPDGRLGVVCYFRDIAEQKKALAAKAYLAAIVDSAEDAILSKDLDGIIQSCNASAERLFGYTSDELVGQPVRMLIPPELQSDEDEILARLRQGHRVEHFETVRITKDGRRVDVALTISPVRDDAGTIIGASKIARDITAVKQAEAERLQLLRENAEVTGTLNSVGAIVASDLDRDKVVQAVTDAATGLTTAEFGAFFYNVLNESGESYTLSTISGAPPEAFARFPMPRNTEVFEPTFKGTGVVRSPDITKDPQIRP